MATPYDSQYSAIRSRIEFYARMYGIDPAVAVWQLWQENRFRSTGCSGAGACGIAQFIPATAARFGVNRNDIESSLNGWGRYMRWLLDRPYINGDIRLALGGYNAGEGRIQQYRGLPPFAETQNYVSTITRNAAASAGQIFTPYVETPRHLAEASGPPVAVMIGAAIALFLILDS